MLRKILLGAGCVGLVGVGLVALVTLLITKDLWYHPDLWFRKLDQKAPVKLDGLAEVMVPPTFHLDGLVNSGARSYFNGETVPPARHFDDRKATWRFVQGQHNDIGGHPTFPAILDITFFRPDLPQSELLPITSTSVGRFYSNMEETPPFPELEWRRVETIDGAETRAMAHRDVYTAGNPERWLVIHVDPRRRVRVDLYAWTSVYRLEDAWKLAREVAATGTPAPDLARHFATLLERRDAEVRAYEKELEQRYGASAPADSAGSGAEPAAPR